MKDRIEDFIQAHKDEFDMHEPPDRVWQSIQKKLPGKKVHYHSNALALAASVLLIVGAFAWFNKTALVIVEQKAGVTIATPEIAEAEIYYAGLVNEQVKELEQYKNKYPDLYHDFQAELSTLNAYYAALKEEYINSPDKEVIKRSIIENLQTQAQIADRQLQIIQDIKGKEESNKLI